MAELAGGTFDNDEDRRRLLVAGQAWLEFGPEKATGNVGAELQVKIPRLLTDLMQDRTALPAQRLEAGQTAADLGHLPDDLDAFVPPLAELGDGLAMAKYPVTNEQYRRFWEDGGYEPTGLGGMPMRSKTLDRYWSETWRSGPRSWDNERFNRPTYPVVGVSWYEADAYCRWLTLRLRNDGIINNLHAVRMTTRYEWEQAVRNDYGREFPWISDRFDPSYANTANSELAGTTPVHMYLEGATVDGICDLVGNVWEWSSDMDSTSMDACWGYRGANEGQIPELVRHRGVRSLAWVHQCRFPSSGRPHLVLVSVFWFLVSDLGCVAPTDF